MSSNFRQIHPRAVELAALVRLILHRLTIIFGRNVVTTLAPSIFNGSSLNLQFTRKLIQALKSLNFSHILTTDYRVSRP